MTDDADFLLSLVPFLDAHHVRTDRIEAIANRLRIMTEILRKIVGNANEAMSFGPFDCIDNCGEPYQSQAFADALKAGRDYLAMQSTLLKEGP